MGPAQGHKVGSVFIAIEGKKEGFSATMAKAKAEGAAAGASISGAMDKAKASTNGLTTSLNGLHTVLGVIGGAALLKSTIDIADKFSLMRSRIRLVTQAGEDMLEIEQQLTNQALRNRAALEPTVALYTRLRQSRADLTDKAAQNLVDLWSKTLIISASSAQEAASSTMQFSQAMAAGVLAGQELRSVIQGNSAFAVYLAQGLGITTGELKRLGEEGKISLDAITDAMAKVGDTIEHDFAKKALTVHQALINVETSMIRWIGLADQGAGGSAKLADWINTVAMNFDKLATVVIAVAASVGTAFAVNAVMGAVTALRALIVQMRLAATAGVALRSVMAFMGGPWGIALGAAVAAVMALGEAMTDTRTATEIAADRMDKMADAIDATNEAILRDRAMKGLVDDLDDVGTAADAVTLKVAAIRAEMVKTGQAAKLAAQDALMMADFEAMQEVARLQAQLDEQLALKAARGTRTKRTTLGGTPEMSPEQIEELRRAVEAIERKRADVQARLQQVLHADAASFLPTLPSDKGAAAPDPAAILDKQLQLELARARGQKERVAQLEDELAVMQLTTQLIERGMKAEEANARAVAHVSALRRAQVSDVEVLAGYTSELEDLNNELLEIEKARAAGATNSSRAAMQAMLDYLNATDDVATVLGKIRDLSGDLLSPEDAKALQAMVDAIDAMQWDKIGRGARDAANDNVAFLANNAPEVAFANDEFEQRMSETIANATKQGLIWGIETGDWGDVFAGILTDIVRESLSSAMDVLFDALSKIDWGMLFNGVAGGTGWGGFFAAMGAGFGGGAGIAGGGGNKLGSYLNRAEGGPVKAGEMLRVGELGSEWFVPNKDGFIIPAGGMKARSAIMPVSIGETHLHVNGLANGVTTEQLSAALEAHRRALPAAIDRRVADRLQRGAY